MDTTFVGNAAGSVPMVIIVAGLQHQSCFYDVHLYLITRMSSQNRTEDPCVQSSC